jgi:hypothetical protein
MCPCMVIGKVGGHRYVPADQWNPTCAGFDDAGPSGNGHADAHWLGAAPCPGRFEDRVAGWTLVLDIQKRQLAGLGTAVVSLSFFL